MDTIYNKKYGSRNSFVLEKTESPVSLEEHAAMRLADRTTVPFECTCDEYATVIILQSREIKELKEKIDNLEDQLENIFNMG